MAGSVTSRTLSSRTPQLSSSPSRRLHRNAFKTSCNVRKRPAGCVGCETSDLFRSSRQGLTGVCGLHCHPETGVSTTSTSTESFDELVHDSHHDRLLILRTCSRWGLPDSRFIPKFPPQGGHPADSSSARRLARPAESNSVANIGRFCGAMQGQS